MTEENKTQKPTRRRAARKKQVDVATETVASQDETKEISAVGDVERDSQIIEPVDAPLDSERGTALAFMEDMITIHLHDPQDNNPEPIVPVGVNGKVRYLRRGEQHTLPRKYIEVLARARRINYRTQDAVASDGSRTMVLKSSTTLQYPFTVVHDPAGEKGVEWLKRIMSERV